MTPKHRPSLYWYLFGACMFVLLIAGATFYLAEAAISPGLAKRYLEKPFSVYGEGFISAREVTKPVKEIQQEVIVAGRAATRQTVVWGLGMAGLVAGGVSFVLTRRLTRPLKDMQRVSRDIAAGQHHKRLDAEAPGEIGELAQAFNTMASELESVEQRRVELLSNVTHELSTPLSSLQGYIEGIEDGHFQADAETLAACKRQLTRLERLIDDLSLLSKVEAGVEVDPQPTEVGALLEGVMATFQPQFVKKGLVLKLEPRPGSLYVLADVERTGQVLNNLVGNAFRHTPSGGEVRLSARRLPDARIEFGVRDSGEGIPSDALPHVFTRFYRADKERGTGAARGSGIGLTIAKHYVEAQGGNIRVESGSGNGGSDFFFTLPGATLG